MNLLRLKQYSTKMEKRFDEEFDAEQDTQKGKFLTFLLGREVCAIEIRLVTEIICLQPITRLPEMPDYICGMGQYQGQNHPRNGCQAAVSA
ncbi:hypothetical protein SDC9_180633 [bioreactor metagenome]|uniref:CheW-like domain-containing protein n=1 Tax=bioreactor metagenome TaxID=1076179 RepID=A0A645H379_9ZZZZ